MSRRIDIELTSRTDDGSWTWRAAGARQPRGVLPVDLVPAAPKAGAIYRAEVETGLDGIEVVSVSAARTASEERGERIEVIGVPQRGPDVSVTLVPGARRRRDSDDRPPRREGSGRPPAGRREGAGRRPPRTGEGDGADAAAGPAPARRTPGRTASTRTDGARREGREGGGRSEDPGRREEGDGRRSPAPPRRERKPAVSTAHRNALLATLRPEQLPVAEQLLRGGIPAVRQAIDEQNAGARADGRPAIAADPLLAMAEELLPAVNLATWKDRATSAQAAGRELRLRELRAVVAASRTVNLDEEGRTLARALQESLDHRVGALRDDWVTRLVAALDTGRVVDALRIAAHPPEPGTRCPAELAVRLAQAAGEAMTDDLAPADWLVLLDAVVEAPVRRNVKPVGIPSDPAVQAAARNASGLVPQLARLLGLRIPPPPPRRTLVRRVPVSPAGGESATAS